MKVKDKNQKRLVSLENEIEPLSTDQEGKLRGGFSAVSTAAMTSGTGNGTCSGNGTCKSNGVCSSNGTCKNNGECVSGVYIHSITFRNISTYQNFDRAVSFPENPNLSPDSSKF